MAPVARPAPNTSALLFGMMVTIALSFGWAFYVERLDAADIHSGALLPRSAWQLCDLQPVAAGAVRHRSARNCVRLLHVSGPL